jgi:DNA-binding transcriptional LysR family regulator
VRASTEVVLGLVTRPDHPLALLRACRLAATVSYGMIIPAEPPALCEHVSVLQSATGVQLSVATASDTVEMIKSLVREGLGVGILTSLDVIEEVTKRELAFVRLSDPVLRPLTLALCQRPARQLSIAANLLLGQLESDFERTFGAADLTVD